MQRSAATTDSYAERLAARAGDLAPAERRVAQQLLDLGPEGTLLSAAALAEQLGTSDATVVRTAKALGYRGLAELRQVLMAGGPNPSPGERLRRTLDDLPREELFAATVRSHLTDLDALTRNVSPEQFEDAVSVLAPSRRVVWRGIGPSAHLAEYGQVLTERIGKPSTRVGARRYVVRRRAAHARAGRRRRFARVRPSAKPCPRLAGSGRRDRAPGRRSDGHLDASAEQDPRVTLQSGRGSPGLFASHGTTVLVIEALVLGMAAANRTQADATLASLNALRGALAGRRIDVDTP